MTYLTRGDICVRAMIEPDITALLKNFYEQGTPRDKGCLENYLKKQESCELSVFTAELGGDAAGYTVLYPYSEEGPFAGNDIPYISDLIVFKKYQNKGVASAILDAAETAAARTSNAVCLGVGLHSGYGAAQKLYVKRGYIPDGTGVWYGNAALAPYSVCMNDDELVLWFSKTLA